MATPAASVAPASPGPSPARAASGNPFKKIPTPVLIAGGGGILGLGYALIRDKGKGATVVDATPPGEATAEGEQYVPSGIGYSQQPIITSDNSGETVGSVGITALDSFASIFGALIPALVEARPSYPPAGAAAAAEVVGGGGGAPPAPTPAAPPVAAAKPAWSLPAGYHAGNSVSEAKYKKVFPGAAGWARVASGDAGVNHWIDYHIVWPGGARLERWRYRPNIKGANAGNTWGLVWKR